MYDRIRNFLENDRVVSISGKISIADDKAPAIIVDCMTEFSLDGEKEERLDTPSDYEASPRKIISQPVRTANPAEGVRLWLNITGLEDADVEELMETLCYYEGDTTVVFVNGRTKMVCTQKVNPGKALMAELSTFLPENCIKLA